MCQANGVTIIMDIELNAFLTTMAYWFSRCLPRVPQQIADGLAYKDPHSIARDLFAIFREPETKSVPTDSFFLTRDLAVKIIDEIASALNAHVYEHYPQYQDQVYCAARATFLAAVLRIGLPGCQVHFTGYPSGILGTEGHVWVLLQPLDGQVADLDPSRPHGHPNPNEIQARDDDGFSWPLR